VPFDAPDWALDMIASARVGRLATVGNDRQPLVVPVCFVLHHERFYSAVDLKPKRTRQLRRVRNVVENPRVSLVIDEYDEDWTRLRWVMVEGDAAVIDGAERAQALAALVAKYAQYGAMNLGETAGDVLAIAPRRIVAWRASD
jgi:PPOX class probable F420-dependent enzyme